MADSYYGQGYEQGGVPGLLKNVWNAPGVYTRNLFNNAVTNPYLNPSAPGPADYGKLNRPQHNIFEELFLYNPGRPMPEQTLTPAPTPEAVQPQQEQTTTPAVTPSFTYPGMKFGAVPEAPDMTKINKAIENLKAPGAKKTDSIATVFQALANTRWDDRSSTGTNLFNAGMQMLAGYGLSKKEAAQAQQEAEQAAYTNDVKKLELGVASQQQAFTNELARTGLIQKKDEQRYKETAPQIVGNSVLYKTRLPSGDIKATAQQVGQSKFERILGVLDKMTANSTVDITHAVQTGQVPPQISQVLTPKVLEYQQMAADQLGAKLALMDDKTKQQMINMFVNDQLMKDPEVGPLIQKMQGPLRQNAILQEALKRGW